MDARGAQRMTAVPAGRFLEDFGAAEGTAGAILNANVPAASDPTEEAFAKGVEAGRAAAQAEHEAKLASQQTLFAKRIDLERQKWIVGVAAKFADTLTMGIRDMEAKVVDSVARVLRPFVETELHVKVVAELQTSLAALLAAEPGMNIHIKGPANILAVLEKQLANKQPPATFETTDDVDVRITAGQAVLETCLGEWLAKLKEAMP
jgi:hypothetical protein